MKRVYFLFLMVSFFYNYAVNVPKKMAKQKVCFNQGIDFMEFSVEIEDKMIVVRKQEQDGKIIWFGGSYKPTKEDFMSRTYYEDENENMWNYLKKSYECQQKN